MPSISFTPPMLVSHLVILVAAAVIVVSFIILATVTRVVTDTLQEETKWSISRICIFTVIVFNLLFSGFCAWKTGLVADLPAGWLALVVLMYTTQKVSAAIVQNAVIKAATPIIVTPPAPVTASTTTTTTKVES